MLILAWRSVQLVLINISDHFMRTQANEQAEPSVEIKVLGILLGQQTGRVVDISNSFEIKAERDAQGSVAIDEAFLTRKQEQCKRLPTGYLLETGAKPDDSRALKRD